MSTAQKKDVGIEPPRPVSQNHEPTGAVTVQAQLEELAMQFCEAARAIDPTIKGQWFGYDLGPDPDGKRLYYLYLEREDRPFVRRPSGNEGV